MTSDTEHGRSPDGSGSRPSDGAQEVSTVPASIHNAALITDIAWLRDRAFMTEKGGDEVIYERIAKRLESLDAECEQAWKSYRMAFAQAMSNGSALAEARASAIEARSDATGTGAAEGESATAESGDAQPQSVSGLSHTGVDRG